MTETTSTQNVAYKVRLVWKKTGDIYTHYNFDSIDEARAWLAENYPDNERIIANDRIVASIITVTTVTTTTTEVIS